MTSLSGEFQTDLPLHEAIVACVQALDGLGWIIESVEPKRVVSQVDWGSAANPPKIEVKLNASGEGTEIRIIGTDSDALPLQNDVLVAELDRARDAIQDSVQSAIAAAAQGKPEPTPRSSWVDAHEDQPTEPKVGSVPGSEPDGRRRKGLILLAVIGIGALACFAIAELRGGEDKQSVKVYGMTLEVDASQPPRDQFIDLIKALYAEIDLEPSVEKCVTTRLESAPPTKLARLYGLPRSEQTKAGFALAEQYSYKCVESGDNLIAPHPDDVTVDFVRKATARTFQATNEKYLHLPHSGIRCINGQIQSLPDARLVVLTNDTFAHQISFYRGAAAKCGESLTGGSGVVQAFANGVRSEALKDEQLSTAVADCFYQEALKLPADAVSQAVIASDQGDDSGINRLGAAIGRAC